MSARIRVALLVLMAGSGAHAQEATPPEQVAAAKKAADAKEAKPWGGALQVDLSAGGDKLNGNLDTTSEITLGQGLTLSGGFFFRPVEHPNFEMQVLAGFKAAAPLPLTAGIYTDVTRWAFQVLADYRRNDRWYFGGGLVLHANPKATYDSDILSSKTVHFDDAVGAMVEGGWNWVGLQCTYMQYHNATVGTLDGSNCGVRFTFHFRKWHPAS